MKENDLAVILNTKKELLINMLDLTKTICELIAAKNIDELNDRLQDRQEIIMLIEILNQKINDLDTDNKMEPDLKKEIISIITDIIAVDNENKCGLEKGLDGCRNQIRDLNLSKKGKGQYSVTKKHDGVFIDQKK